MMRTRRYSFFIVMALAALGALFLPMASFAASCTMAPCSMMSEARSSCAHTSKMPHVVVEHAVEDAPDATSHRCAEHGKPGENGCHHCQDDSAAYHPAFGSKSNVTQSVSSRTSSLAAYHTSQYRVLDSGCGCHVEPSRPYLQAGFQAPFHAPDLWAIVPARAVTLVLPLAVMRGFLPLCHAPPRPGVELSRASPTS